MSVSLFCVLDIIWGLYKQLQIMEGQQIWKGSIRTKKLAQGLMSISRRMALMFSEFTLMMTNHILFQVSFPE